MHGRLNWDFLGIGISSLCAVHCLALPMVVGILPILGLEFLTGPSVHRLLALGVTAFCLLAIVPGYLRHRHQVVLLGMTSGLAFVLFATFFSQATIGQHWEIPLITVGNILVIGAHFANRKLFKSASFSCDGCLSHTQVQQASLTH